MKVGSEAMLSNSNSVLKIVEVVGTIVTIIFLSPAGAQPSNTFVQKLEGVVIETSSDVERRESVGPKIIMTREEINKFGDKSLLGVLSRISGISIGAGTNQTSEVKLRGLDTGYVQIQVNGEPVAPGFSIDSLSPEMVVFAARGCCDERKSF
jgi:outer membrane receptor for ferrienterochelin and colicin